MTLHAILQYLMYRYKAKGRHGMHSPFVYKFIEDGLQKIKATSLMELLIAYFGSDSIVFIEDTHKLEHLFSTYANEIARGKLIAIKDIHKTAATTREWENIKNGRRVTLSIDLYQYGLIFFNPDFREKQHFILKYPA